MQRSVMRRASALLFTLLLAAACAAAPSPSLADSKDGTSNAAVSPKAPWGDFKVVERPAPYSTWERVLLWFPNRIVDLLDVFRVDVGVGPAAGGVVRVSRYGQAGYRTMSPGSLRVGLFGRRAPVLVESSNEFGIGPAYVESKDRKVCAGEIGLGLDALIVGGYAGICLEELADFALGIFTIDLMDDDIK